LKTQVLSTPHSAHQPLTPEPPVESPTGAEVWVPPCSAKQPETGSQEPAKLVLQWFLYSFMVIAWRVWRFYGISWDFIGI
jgi:hypothetical protein